VPGLLEGMLGTLEKLSPQDLVALGVVAFALVACLVCFPCYLAFVAATGCGPTRVQSVCSYILRLPKKRSRFNYHQIVPHVYLGSLPRTMQDLNDLKKKGVGAMVTLNEAWEMELSNRFVRDDCGMQHLHLPTPDFFAPKQEDIQAAVQFITQFVSRGIGVYVHCNGGKGRSAVCVICYLARFHAETPTPEKAYDHVSSKRRIASMRGCCGLHKQWRAVKRFCRSFTRKSRKEAFPASDAPTTLPSPNVGVSASSGSSGSVRNVATTERNDVMASKIDANSSPLVIAKPQVKDAASQASFAQFSEETPEPQKLPFVPESDTCKGEVAVPDTHVTIAAPIPEPMMDPRAPGDVHEDYQEDLEYESSDSDEEPPLLE